MNKRDGRHRRRLVCTAVASSSRFPRDLLQHLPEETVVIEDNVGALGNVVIAHMKLVATTREHHSRRQRTDGARTPPVVPDHHDRGEA